MTDPVIRPGNGLLLIALQSAEGTPATPNPATDVVPCETDSLQYNGPYKTQAADEATGSFAASSPLVMGQPATISFRSRLRGPGQALTSSVKSSLHAPLMAAGWNGVFTASVSAAALATGTTSTATLGTGFAATAQIYRGMPLVLTSAPAVGRISMITDYSAAKVATLADLFGSALSATNTGAIPANWTYAPTSPYDATSRGVMHPCATIQWYEDGICYTWTDCRATFDPDGNTGEAGFGAFNFTGIFAGKSLAAVPSNAVLLAPTPPLVVQGVGGVQPALQVNRRGLPVSKWSIKTNAQLDSPPDPNTAIGYAAGTIADRSIVLQLDPHMTFPATRDALAEIAAFTQYPAAIQAGTTAGNRWALTLPVVQPTDTSPTTRNNLRAETLNYTVTSPGRDNSGRDGDAVLCIF